MSSTRQKRHQTMPIVWLAVLAMFIVGISGLSIGTVNAYEVGVEWTNDYSPLGWHSFTCADDLAIGFYNKLGEDGWSKDFNWGDYYAYEEDFKKESIGGTDYDWIDEVDFALYAGHGLPKGFYFNNDHDDKELTGTKSHHDAEWGDLDLEWIAINACLVLNKSSDEGEWYERWGWGVFKGLHQIDGFDTETGMYCRLGEKFAGYMIEDGYTIREAWFKASEDGYPSTMRAAVMGVCDKGYSTYDDHLWGHGSVAPDKNDPSCLFWVSHTC